jgi:hypothetical protein
LQCFLMCFWILSYLLCIAMLPHAHIDSFSSPVHCNASSCASGLFLSSCALQCFLMPLWILSHLLCIAATPTVFKLFDNMT